MKTDTPRPIRLKDYKPSPWTIEAVTLDVSLHPTATRVKSRLKVKPNPASSEARAPLILDGEMLELESLKLDGKVLEKGDYDLTPETLILRKPPSAPAFNLEIVTHINPEANKALNGLYRSRGIYTTQCEAEGFRRITYFLDRPDILSTYVVRVEAAMEEASVLLANGNPSERGTLDRGRRHFAVWKDPHPKPCYLFALVGGNLASIASTFKTMSGREVDLRIYVEPGKEARAHWAMDSLKRSMKWDEKRFGREYDLDVFNIVAVSDFNMGAMENKGLNIFNDRLILASPETATDANFEAIESVVAHEYFHNWTGNRITCRDWFQLCLKEGLTVYRDQEFSADERSRAVQRIADVKQLKAAQFPEDAGPLAHPVRPDTYIEINNFYTSTVYDKGAELVRMIETMAGVKGFRAGMDRYFERHDGTAATVEDFLESFEHAAKLDLTQFKQWYAQSGTPELVAKITWDKAKKTADLIIEQVNTPTTREPKKKPLHIPIRMGLLGANGQEIPLQRTDGSKVEDGVIHLTAQKQTFSFENVTSRPVPSLLRGFSAPVKLSIDLAERDLEFLMVHDGDLYNRWQATTDFATRTLIHIVRARESGKRSTKGAAYAAALREIIGNTKLEPAYLAELLRLPSESDIAREIARNVDPGAIHAARRQLIRFVGTTLGEDLERLYQAHTSKGAFAPNAAGAGRRALRNTVLGLLAARDTPADRKRLLDHHSRAGNMTDEAASLYLIAASRLPEREACLARFHERWKGDHLVIDTWFTAQAIVPEAPTLDRVRALMKDENFSLSAPNKVRALIGNFAMANPSQFNRPDGAGYQFLAEQVLAIEKFNPQIAARLLNAFRSWRALEPERRRHARRALQGVARTEGLSRDVFEIAAKMIE